MLEQGLQTVQQTEKVDPDLERKAMAKKNIVQAMVIGEILNISTEVKSRNKDQGETQSISIEKSQVDRETEAMEMYLKEYSLLFNALLTRADVQKEIVASPAKGAKKIMELNTKFKPEFDAEYSSEIRSVMVDKPTEDFRAALKRMVHTENLQ